jgi:hypothetical protein
MQERDEQRVSSTVVSDTESSGWGNIPLMESPRFSGFVRPAVSQKQSSSIVVCTDLFSEIAKNLNFTAVYPRVRADFLH